MAWPATPSAIEYRSVWTPEFAIVTSLDPGVWYSKLPPPLFGFKLSETLKVLPAVTSAQETVSGAPTAALEGGEPSRTPPALFSVRVYGPAPVTEATVKMPLLAFWLQPLTLTEAVAMTQPGSPLPMV